MPTANDLPNRILLATGNAHKAEEMRAILVSLLPAYVKTVTLKEIDLPPIPDEVESFSTFTANARAKAVWCRDRSGLDCIADDSGLCVDALGGAPGILSARWAGPSDAHRNLRLLEELSRVGAHSPEQRAAWFACSAAYAPASGEAVSALGRVHGIILDQPRGVDGFGYDPLFYIPELNCTMAQAGAAVKNRISHRAGALKALISLICTHMP